MASCVWPGLIPSPAEGAAAPGVGWALHNIICAEHYILGNFVWKKGEPH